MQPWKGWRLRVAGTVTGLARCFITWKNNTGDPWAAIATHSKVYALDVGGTLSDITPAGYVAGIASSSVNLGFGGGLFGRGFFGTPRSLSSTAIPATVVALETWGQDLLICSPADGKIYEWALVPAVLPDRGHQRADRLHVDPGHGGTLARCHWRPAATPAG
jgi:hypothetical protein